jgi:hypothetical protein
MGNYSMKNAFPTFGVLFIFVFFAAGILLPSQSQAKADEMIWQTVKVCPFTLSPRMIKTQVIALKDALSTGPLSMLIHLR